MGNGTRLAHVSAVAARVQTIGLRPHDTDTVEAAAWLHDIGYAIEAAKTGFHALDGARLLDSLGAPASIVSLVGYHSGAEFEAAERGLSDDLAEIRRPDQRLLDALTYADMTTGPTGESLTVDERLIDILARYGPDHPVHRAVQRSRGDLADSVQRTTASAVITR
jgi:hypothetical protein